MYVLWHLHKQKLKNVPDSILSYNGNFYSIQVHCVICGYHGGEDVCVGLLGCNSVWTFR
jgi:hypothetical protein